MKKYDLAYIIANSDIYEGDYTVKELMKLSKQELSDMYQAMEEAEYEYYELLN